jgi:hypothetical protein
MSALGHKRSPVQSVCPLWVKSRHVQRKRACPLYPQSRRRLRFSPERAIVNCQIAAVVFALWQPDTACFHFARARLGLFDAPFKFFDPSTERFCRSGNVLPDSVGDLLGRASSNNCSAIFSVHLISRSFCFAPALLQEFCSQETASSRRARHRTNQNSRRRL